MSLNQADYDGAYQTMMDHQRILISPHANVDPDGLGSALALYMILKQLGKDVTVVCPDTKPSSLEFLPGFEKLTEGFEESQNFVITVNLEEGVEVDKLRYTVEDSKVNIIVMPKSGKITKNQITIGDTSVDYDLLCIVDTADLPLLGSVYSDHTSLFEHVPILNIDHHISNTKFGNTQLIDPTAASATEVLYSWFMHIPDWKDRLNPDIATLLLTGLITDTRSFQNPNTTPRSLEVAAELLEHGARQQEIIKNIYKTKPLSTLKIWGRALNAIQVDDEAGIVWSSISNDDLNEMSATSKETHGILDELISTIPDADVYILFTELEDGGLKASARSSTAIDISRLAAKLYGGGGHARAAGFKVHGFSNFQLAVVDCVSKIKEGMVQQKHTSQSADPQLVSVVESTSQPVDLQKSDTVDVVEQLNGDIHKLGSIDIVEGLNSNEHS